MAQKIGPIRKIQDRLQVWVISVRSDQWSMTRTDRNSFVPYRQSMKHSSGWYKESLMEWLLLVSRVVSTHFFVTSPSMSTAIQLSVFELLTMPASFRLWAVRCHSLTWSEVLYSEGICCFSSLGRRSMFRLLMFQWRYPPSVNMAQYPDPTWDYLE